MHQRSCRFCRCSFHASRFHPEQTVCAAAECQRRRRREYHRHKIAADSVYHQVCKDSSQKWRAENPGYWKRYRQAHPDQAEQNRVLQQGRDQKRRIRDLANNNSALDLTRISHPKCAGGSERGSTRSFRRRSLKKGIHLRNVYYAAGVNGTVDGLQGLGGMSFCGAKAVLRPAHRAGEILQLTIEVGRPHGLQSAALRDQASDI